MFPVCISRPPCAWSPTAHSCPLAEAQLVFRMMPMMSHPSPLGLFHPYQCPHPSLLSHPGHVSSLPWLSLKKQWCYKNLATGCNHEKPSRAAPRGCRVWERERGLPGITNWEDVTVLLSQHARYQFRGGRTRGKSQLQGGSVLETWPAHQQRASSCSPNLQ